MAEDDLDGWQHVESRDFAEVVEIGFVDADLNRMREVIGARLDEVNLRPCPACGQPLRDMHEHDGFNVVPIVDAEVVEQ